MPGGPRWCAFFLILYRTPFCIELNITKPNVVRVCLLLESTIEQNILKFVTVAKHLVVLTVLEDFRKNNGLSQPIAAGAIVKW